MSSSVKKMAKGAGGSLLVIGSARILKLLLQLLLSRVLGAADYGIFTLLMAVTYLGSAVSSLGIPASSVRFGAAFASTGQKDKFNKFISKTFILLIAFSVFITTCLYIFRSDVMTVLNMNEDISFIFAVCLWSIPIINVGQWVAGILQSQSAAAKASLMNELAPILFRSAFISIGLFISGNLFAVVMGHYAGVFFVLVLGMLFISKMLLNSSFNDISYMKNSISDITPTFTRLISISTPMMLSGLTYTLLLYVDRFMIAHYIVEPAYVGIYSVASMIALQMAVVLIAVISIFSPMITSAYTLKKIDRMRVLLQRATWWVTMLSAPICIIIAFNANLLMGIFGDEFRAGTNVLIILTAAQFYNIATGPVGIVLQMTGRQKIDLVINLILLVVNVILNILLIPVYGFEGAAIATLVSMVAVHSFRLYVVWRLHGYCSITVRQSVVGLTGFVFLFIGLLIHDISAIAAIIVTITVITIIIYIIYRYAFDDEDLEIVNLFFQKLNPVKN